MSEFWRRPRTYDTRRARLQHVNVAEATAAIATAMTQEPTKKDTHFVSRVRNHVCSFLGQDYQEVQYVSCVSIAAA